PVNRRAIADRWTGRPRGGLIVQMRPLQLGEEFVLVAEEALPQVEKLVKPADEGLIVQAQARNHRPQTFGNLLGILRFQVVVNQQNHRNGGRFRSEVNDLLFDGSRSEEHTSELQSRGHLVCRLLLEKKKQTS